MHFDCPHVLSASDFNKTLRPSLESSVQYKPIMSDQVDPCLQSDLYEFLVANMFSCSNMSIHHTKLAFFPARLRNFHCHLMQKMFDFRGHDGFGWHICNVKWFGISAWLGKTTLD